MDTTPLTGLHRHYVPLAKALAQAMKPCREWEWDMRELYDRPGLGTEEELLALEASLGFRLPDSYRAFLLFFGGGEDFCYYEYRGVSEKDEYRPWPLDDILPIEIYDNDSPEINPLQRKSYGRGGPSSHHYLEAFGFLHPEGEYKNMYSRVLLCIACDGSEESLFLDLSQMNEQNECNVYIRSWGAWGKVADSFLEYMKKVCKAPDFYEPILWLHLYKDTQEDE